MELLSSLAFIGDHNTLLKIDNLISEETVLEHMINSIDYIPELETNDTYIYRVHCDSDSWVNIYEIKKILEQNLQNLKCDIIYANTDGYSYVEVISTSGNFDTYVDTNDDKIEDLCKTYGLEFYGSSTSDDYQFDDEDDNDDYSDSTDDQYY